MYTTSNMDTNNNTPDTTQSNQPGAVPPPEPPTVPTPPVTPLAPSPVQPIPAAPPPPPPPAQPGDFPGRTLGIVGFVLAFFFPLAGLILSIVASKKAKQAGVKFGLATAGIILNAVFLALGALFWALVIVAAVKGGQNCVSFGEGPAAHCTSDSQGGTQTGSSSTATKTYTASTLSFQYPGNWTQTDTSNAHYFAPDGAYDTYDLFYSPATIGSADKPAGIIVYSVQKAEGSASASTIHATAVAAMKANVEKMKTWDGNGRDTGHGCASNWKLTEGPTYQEKDQLVGMTYSYTCKSPYDGQIHGSSGVWYDQYGSTNRLDVTAVDSYYNANSQAINAIVPSVHQ